MISMPTTDTDIAVLPHHVHRKFENITSQSDSLTINNMIPSPATRQAHHLISNNMPLTHSFGIMLDYHCECELLVSLLAPKQASL